MKRFLWIPILVMAVITSLGQEFSQRYELVTLGKEVNTFYHEAAPVISPDGKDLYFFVQNHPENTFGKSGSQDIWITRKDDQGNWSAAKRLDAPFNKNRSNQVFTVLPDGSLFIRGKRSTEGGFSIVSPSGQWSEVDIKGFDDMNKGRFNGASMSSDGKHIILYFSEIPTSIRSSLYVSNLQPNGSWSIPVRLSFSDRSDEYGPYIGPDNKTLYFASDRKGEKYQGGADIYKSVRMDETWMKWTDPVNLGPPINTSAGDAYFSIDAAGHVYTSRANSRVDGGNLDLYVLVPKDITITLNGIVYNSKTNAPLAAPVEITFKKNDPIQLKAGADGKFGTKIPEVSGYTISASIAGFEPGTFTFDLPYLVNDTTLQVDVPLKPVAKQLVLSGNLMDSKTNNPINGSISFVSKAEGNRTSSQPVNGSYKRDIDKMGWYVLTGSAEGYINTTDSVLIDSEETNPWVKDVYLRPIEVGMTVRLKNIYFDYNKATLKSESFVELNKVVDFLNKNAHVEVEISGHTDSKGPDDYNLNLSQGRSQSVVDYLVSQGIDLNRLTAKGYGESVPIDTNDTDDGRANNRRVEFTILKVN
ncbi:MAG: OmpA family protein [Flammeovirgaceae bacterium]|nr:OmpA family protein [Flammeovirgaceae bacterium]